MFAGQKFSSKTEMLRQPRSGRQLGERAAQYRTVRRVVDGDTLVLENKERVRLIGVDTPETKHPRILRQGGNSFHQEDDPGQKSETGV